MATPISAKPRLLTVDDEPSVSAGIAMNFRRELEVVAATSGAEALAAIDQGPTFAIVLSDMHMPKMNGIELLAEVRRRSPDSVRVLLTGNADLETAISSVNEGQLFRFLRKPASREELRVVLMAAAEHHALITSERVLLEQTLRGTIEALMDMLAVMQPSAFGQAAELRKMVQAVGADAGVKHLWRLEVAAMFAQLSLVAVSPEALEKTTRGIPLDDADKAGFARGGQLVERLLDRIPRLEAVRAILVEDRQSGARKRPSPDAETTLAAQVLRLCADFARLVGQGLNDHGAIETLQAREGAYDARMLESLARFRGIGRRRAVLKEIGLRGLMVGMVLAEDLHTQAGVLLARKGYEVTDSFVERAEGFARGFVREPIKVLAETTD